MSGFSWFGVDGLFSEDGVGPLFRHGGHHSPAMQWQIDNPPFCATWWASSCALPWEGGQVCLWFALVKCLWQVCTIQPRPHTMLAPAGDMRACAPFAAPPFPQESEDLFETCSQALLSALDRDCLSGWGATVVIITKDKAITRQLKADPIPSARRTSADLPYGSKRGVSREPGAIGVHTRPLLGPGKPQLQRPDG